MNKKSNMNRKSLAYAAILFTIGFLVYMPNLNNGLFWDDNDLIVNNIFIKEFSWDNIKATFNNDQFRTVGSSYYRPLLFILFTVSYAISGIKPLAYHLTNNLIHIANGILMFIILDAFIKKRSFAFLVALLFLVHPLQTGTVTYITGIGLSLAVFLMSLALVMFLLGDKKWPGKENVRYRSIYKLSSYLLAILSVLSMEIGFLFPAYLILFLMTFVYKESFWLALIRSVKKAIPYIVISTTYIIIRIYVLDLATSSFIQGSFMGALVYFNQRIYIFLSLITLYSRLIFVPLGLRNGWAIESAGPLFYMKALIGAGITIGVIFMTVKDFARTRLWFFSWGCFLLGLTLTSLGLSPLRALFYEHWLYFSLFGFFILFIFYLDRLRIFMTLKNEALSNILVIIFIGWICFIAILTTQRNILFGDQEKLYKSILKYEPSNGDILTNLGAYYLGKGMLKEAEELSSRAIRGDTRDAPAYLNMGIYFSKIGDNDKAAEYWKLATKVDPNYVYPFYNLIGHYLLRDDEMAKYYLKEMDRFSIYDPVQNFNIGQAAFKLGEKDVAIRYLNKALEYAVADPMLTKAAGDLLEKIKNE